VANLHAKLEVSTFNRSRDMEGVPKFQKSRSRDHFTAPFDLILHSSFRSPGCQSARQIWSFKVSSFNRSEIWRGSQSFKK